MPPRSSGAQELGAQLQSQVESLRSTSSAAASRAERSLRAELAEARAELAEDPQSSQGRALALRAARFGGGEDARALVAGLAKGS